MMTPTLTAGASARTGEMMEGAASKAAVPESIVRRFIRIVPTEFSLDIASSQISCFSNGGATLPYDEGGVYRAFRISTTA
jgi:hypothetical protein